MEIIKKLLTGRSLLTVYLPTDIREEVPSRFSLD
jgi:hypothetical protein